MEIIKYKKTEHKKIIKQLALALKKGMVVAYPTDTSYGLACDITNNKGLRKLYQIKERNEGKPIHVVIPSLEFAKSAGEWSITAQKLAKAFWPGALTLVLPLKNKSSNLKKISAKTNTIGLRFSKNKIAQDLANALGEPISATSANPSKHISGGFDSYTAQEIFDQFEGKKYQPDIILDAGKLEKKKPSTIVKVVKDEYEILRVGPISEIQIKKAIKG